MLVAFVASISACSSGQSNLDADSGTEGQCLIVPGGDLGHPDREQRNYVEGGGFESPAGDWVIDGQGVTVSSEQAQQGSASMHFKLSTGAATLRQKLYFVKGFNYTFSAWFRGAAKAISARVIPVTHNQLDDDGAIVLPVKISNPSPLSDWTDFSISKDISSNPTYYQLEIVVNAPADVYLDEVSMTAQVYQTATVPAAAVEPLRLYWLIHIEDPESVKEDEATFTAKATVFEELARLFHKHGATLVIQPELAILQGSEEFDKDFVKRLTENYGVTWSTHTHGPKGPDPTMDDVIAYVKERQDALEKLDSGPVTDHNGNFDQAELGRLSEIGFTTLSAYKYQYTQFPALGYYLNPWRPASLSPLENEAGWAVHQRNGSLVFMPSTGTSVLRVKSQTYELVERYLTSALSKVVAGQINSYAFVDHVDHFQSLTGKNIAEYVAGAEFQADLAAYDEVLGELIGPLVDSGHVRWSTIAKINAAYESWEADSCPKEEPSTSE